MSTLLNIFRLKSLRNNILFVLGVLVLFRLVAHLPVPGVDASDLSGVIQGSQFFGLLNIFSGGTLDTFSIVALGVAPYITSSIIFQLLGMISPHLEEMQKEEAGRQKINQWTRLATVPLAVIQAYGLTVLLSQQVPSLADGFVGVNILLIILAMTAGTVFMMWLGELISERHIGNGISILIFAGIIAGLPSFLQQTFLVFDRSDLITLIIFLVMVLATVYAIVVTNEAQRNIPIQHARQIRGARMLGGASSHLPLRLIMAGVIPIIFAISIILLPTTAGQFLINAQTPWIEQAATWMLQVFNNQLVYGVLYFLLVFGFTYFYTAVIFKPENVSELIAVLPLVVQQFTGSANLVIGGTSILIIVAVVIDMIKQIDAQLTMHSYDM
ncbi:MAG: Protein translocase subunit SecY [Parcubacteria group bacterium GW2011_GWA2_53_21]|nr:MAG: Protein translocase subunit SecY [Parcubacteria group bacterium GW2011_GWA2_53_21]